VKYFNLDAIISAQPTFQKAPGGFRYGFIPNIFKEDVYDKLVAGFPSSSSFKLVDKPSGGGRKRFYSGPHYETDYTGGCVCHLEQLSNIWKEVMKESASAELITTLSKATDINFNSLGMFGFAYGDEGCMQEAHIDGVIRDNPSVIKSPIACLIYINKDAEGSSGTRIYNTDRTTTLFKAPGMRNGLFFFEQNINAWHGFPIVPVGEERRLLSLGYNIEKNPIQFKKSLIHKLICVHGWKFRIKSLLSRTK